MTEPTANDTNTAILLCGECRDAKSMEEIQAAYADIADALAAARHEERLRGNRSDDAITGETLTGLSEDPLSSKAAIAWLTEAARYFSARNTGGEDAAHWANVSNSIMCRRIAGLIRNIPEMTEPTDRDRKLFFDALEGLQEVMAIGGPAARLTMGKHFVPAIAAAREEGRREERERCAKIAERHRPRQWQMPTGAQIAEEIRADEP